MIKVVILIATLVFASPSYSAIIWDESIDGDIGIGQNIGSLQIGTNTFLGTFSLFRTGGNAAHADTETGIINLADNLQIISMEANIIDTYGYGVLGYSRFAGLHSPTVSSIYIEEMYTDTIYTNLLPFSETGAYSIFTGGGGASVEDDVEFFWDWEINIEVVSVPAPSSLTLFLVGILALGLLKTTSFNSLNTAKNLEVN